MIPEENKEADEEILAAMMQSGIIARRSTIQSQNS